MVDVSTRRSSMSEAEAKERRSSIQNIMRDPSLTPLERRRSIQYLMDGRRNSTGYTPASNSSSSSSQHPVAVPQQPQQSVGSSMVQTSKRMEETRPECNHYDRKCSIISPCCGAAFGCRVCHDECSFLPPAKFGTHAIEEDNGHNNSNNGGLPSADQMRISSPNVSPLTRMSTIMGSSNGSKIVASKPQKLARCSSMPMSFEKMPEPEHHNIDRFAIREIICRECYTRQSSKTNECVNCYAQFGDYHCDTCNLWMSAEDNPYHCEHCGFCRVGGRENFRHCFSCGMCIDTVLFSQHNCKAGKYMSDCPVCQENMFSSRSASHEMPCGHAIHWHCFQNLVSYDSRCPVCKKTAESPEKMAPTWNTIRMGIKMQPLPTELNKVVNITCNDCEERCFGLRWHFLGVQCKACNSFNTSIDRIVMTGEEASQYLGAVEGYNHFDFQGDDMDIDG